MLDRQRGLTLRRLTAAPHCHQLRVCLTLQFSVAAAFSVVEESGRRVMRADERVIAIGEHGNSARRRVRIVGADVVLGGPF